VDLEDGCAIEASEDAVVREVNGEAVLLHQETELCFSLDAVSTIVWRTLTSAPNLGAALAELEERFGVERNRIRADLEPFISALVDEGLALVRLPAG
jgi:hypothetical protein